MDETGKPNGTKLALAWGLDIVMVLVLAGLFMSPEFLQINDHKKSLQEYEDKIVAGYQNAPDETGELQKQLDSLLSEREMVESESMSALAEEEKRISDLEQELDAQITQLQEEEKKVSDFLDKHSNQLLMSYASLEETPEFAQLSEIRQELARIDNEERVALEKEREKIQGIDNVSRTKLNELNRKIGAREDQLLAAEKQNEAFSKLESEFDSIVYGDAEIETDFPQYANIQEHRSLRRKLDEAKDGILPKVLMITVGILVVLAFLQWKFKLKTLGRRILKV